jgi:NADH dehydrogenase (ubiquinone) flavoprotein 1
LFKYLI